MAKQKKTFGYGDVSSWNGDFPTNTLVAKQKKTFGYGDELLQAGLDVLAQLVEK